MKKAAALFFAVLILAAGGFCTIAWAADREKDQVHYSENVLFGDVSHAEGLTISAKAHYDRHLFWNTRFEPGKEPAVRADYHFSAAEEQPPYQHRWNGMNLKTDLEVADHDALQSDEPLTGISKAFQELYQEMEHGTDAYKKIDLRDYFEYFPMRFELDLPGIYWSNRDYDNLSDGVENSEKDVIDHFREFFRIPTPENSMIEIHLHTDKDGRITSSGHGSSSSECFYPYAVSTWTKDQCWFTFLDGDGNHRIDTNLIPGGYGIYRFAYESVENQRLTEGSFTGVHGETLELFYPLGPDVRTLYMKPDENEENLILITEEQDQYCFQVIRMADGELLQKFVFMEGENRAFETHPYDDFWVFDTFDSLILVERLESGEYVLRFEVEQPENLREYHRLYNLSSMDFDGEKLAVSCFLYGSKHHNFETCGIYLGVYDKTGLLYAGEYPCSLTPNPFEEIYQMNCFPYEIQAEWK